MKRYLPIAILISVFFVVGAEMVSACSCRRPVDKTDKELVDEEKAEVDFVFVGRVIKIVKDRIRRGVFPNSYTAVFEVREIWKGTKRKQIRVVNGQCCNCVMSFIKSKEYLVYAEGKNTDLEANVCGRTKETNDPQLKVDRQYLGASITLKK